jgi:hypothetical protein
VKVVKGTADSEDTVADNGGDTGVVGENHDQVRLLKPMKLGDNLDGFWRSRSPSHSVVAGLQRRMRERIAKRRR